uniref:Uncharacterized protein n=1 Tax=Plectus sambesii TaxID=2011161 RepID=A0A914WQJ7_9BILA
MVSSMLLDVKRFPLLLSINFLFQFITSDDSVHFDWFNSTTLLATSGTEVVCSESKLDIVVCYFDDKDRRFVFCNPNSVQVESDSQLNPFGSGNARNLSYGIWLQSPTTAWVDKTFGIPFSPRDASSFVHIVEYAFYGDSEYTMKIQPINADFPQVTMKFFLTCQNGSIYCGSEMDLSEYVGRATAADYTAPISSGLTESCTEACAEIYIRAIDKSNQEQHKFRVGALCRPFLRKRNEVMEMFVGKIRMALNDLLHDVIPQRAETNEE